MCVRLRRWWWIVSLELSNIYVKRIFKLSSFSKLFFNRCIRFDPLLRERAPQGTLDELWQDVESFSAKVLWLCLLGFFSSLVVLALLWYIPRALIWTLVFGTIVVCVAGTGWFWIKWHLEDGESRWLYFALGSTLMCFLVGIFLAAVWKKVTLMVQLLHESGLALKSMVLLVFLPVLVRGLQEEIC